MGKRLLYLFCFGGIFLAMTVFSGCGGGSSDSSPTATTSGTSSVEGMVSGLIGSGLVLQNNGSDDLAVTADEKYFKFTTRVKEGSHTDVTVKSQPINPAQTCEVLNGSRIVSVSNITDVQVKCATHIDETFESGGLNSSYWSSSGQYERKLVDSKLQFNLAATGEFAFDQLPFLNPNCGKISADVAITDTVFTGTGVRDFRTRLHSCGYHSNLAGEALGTRTGDVEAAINWNGTEASYQVLRCLNDECDNWDSIEYLTPNGSAGVPLGTTAANTTANLSIEWNNPTGQFSFQLNNEAPKTFNPVAAGAAIAAAVPNKPEKYLGVQIYITEPNDKAEMTATFDNVTDGPLTDDFDLANGKYLNSSFWKKTNGKRQIESGKLVMETAQEFIGDPIADNRLNNTTSLHTHDQMLIKGAEVVEADLTLDTATFVVDNGANPAEVFALLEMEFKPPGSQKNDFTDFFVLRAALKEGPGGVVAQILAEGCADYSCTTKHTIANATQDFLTPVDEAQTHRFKIEHRGNGAFDITMNGTETLSVDLSSIPEFASTAFSAVALRTASKGTDLAGEEAFVRAFFDNVRAGSL